MRFIPKARGLKPTEFKEQWVGLVQAGRSLKSPARDYESCAEPIHDWLKHFSSDGGERYECLDSGTVLGVSAQYLKLAFQN